MISKRQVRHSGSGLTQTDGHTFRALEPGTEPISKVAAGRTGSALILERLYREVLEGKTLAEAHGGIVAEANPAVRIAVRDCLLLWAQREPPKGIWKIDYVVLAKQLGLSAEAARQANHEMRKTPPQFRAVLFDMNALERMGEELGAGRMPSLLADKTHWNRKYWDMVTALATGAYEGSFKNSETNPLHYLIKRHGRKALEGIISPEFIRQLACRLGVGLRKPTARLTPEQREFVEAFAGKESDAEIARALRLPESTVYYFRARMGVGKKEAVEGRQAAAQARELLMAEMQKIIANNGRITDEDLTSRLQIMGFPIARRTVTKYRNMLDAME